MAHGFGNSHGQTRPDEKMGRGMERERRMKRFREMTSVQNAILKRRAAKKRRQRDV